LRLEESDGLSTSTIKAVTMDMLAGGTETSSTVVEWAMVELLRNPRAMEKAQAELRQLAVKGKKKTISETDIQDLTYLKMVIRETMRLHAPIPLLIPRQCREECELGGYTIPVKTQFIINAWAIARDPENWHDPERFEPERFCDTFSCIKGNEFEYLPFGAGRRMCPGISFGMASVEHTLAQLLYHFDWKLPRGMKPEDIDMTEKFGIAAKIKNNLIVVATPYSPL
jgi:cytochrome P450